MEKIVLFKKLKKQKSFIDFYVMEKLDQGHYHPKLEVLDRVSHPTLHGERRAL